MTDDDEHLYQHRMVMIPTSATHDAATVIDNCSKEYTVLVYGLLTLLLIIAWRLEVLIQRLSINRVSHKICDEELLRALTLIVQRSNCYKYQNEQRKGYCDQKQQPQKDGVISNGIGGHHSNSVESSSSSLSELKANIDQIMEQTTALLNWSEKFDYIELDTDHGFDTDNSSIFVDAENKDIENENIINISKGHYIVSVDHNHDQDVNYDNIYDEDGLQQI